MRRTRTILGRVLLCALLLTGLCTGSWAGAESAPPAAAAQQMKQREIGVAPSQEEILRLYQDLGIKLDGGAVSYAAVPKLDAPYQSGQVAQNDLQESLTLLNFIRFVAGVPNDVVINDTYASLAQHAAALMAANTLLSHTQVKRPDMLQNFYALGSKGTAECNLGRGYPNIDASLLNYMQDTDHVNIFAMGHRRWLLNPSMQATGFGFANGYSATYAFDRTRTGDLNFDYIAWPAANMPMELYTPRKGNYAFTLVLGKAYSPAKLEDLTVTLTCGGNSWTLTKADSTLASFQGQGRYLGVNTENYGPANCIIFSVGAFQTGDQVDITVRGLEKNGQAVPLTYRVNFFSMTAPESNGAATIK